MPKPNPQTTPFFIERTVACLKECADDLQAEIDAKYDGLQDKYPSLGKKYQRDITPITNARNLIAEYEAGK